MNEFMCGKCGWRATALSIEGMLAAEARADTTNETGEDG